jgi:hypothetical protein
MGDYLGQMVGNMNRRRGKIIEQVERGTNTAVVATIPLSEIDAADLAQSPRRMNGDCPHLLGNGDCPHF